MPKSKIPYFNLCNVVIPACKKNGLYFYSVLQYCILYYV